MTKLIDAIKAQDFKATIKAATGFTFKSKTGELTISNCSFDPSTMRAYSYSHWCFANEIEGVLIFNDYRYSNTTSKHQSKISTLLRTLKLYPAFHVRTKSSIESWSLSDVLDWSISELAMLTQQEFECKRKDTGKHKAIVQDLIEMQDQVDLLSERLRTRKLKSVKA